MSLVCDQASFSLDAAARVLTRFSRCSEIKTLSVWTFVGGLLHTTLTTCSCDGRQDSAQWAVLLINTACLKCL